MISTIGLIFVGLALSTHLVSAALAAYRCRKGQQTVRPADCMPVSIVRPLKGLEQYSQATLESSFNIDYPNYEILFCVADARDPVVPLVRSLIATNPELPARILFGMDGLGSNPKLNNMAKGFYKASHDYIVFVDSNVLIPADYLDQIVTSMQSGAGMVTAPPVGQMPDGVWAELECAFLNTYQARVQYAIDTFGFGFAQGKTLCFHRQDLERGGLESLGSEPAEDAAATKLIRNKGKNIRLAGPFSQLIGRRDFMQVWDRQLRWARLRRASFPLLFAPEIAAGVFPPLVVLIATLSSNEMSPIVPSLFFVLCWYGAEFLLACIARWPISLKAMLTRDALLPFLYVWTFFGNDFVWHGSTVKLKTRTSSRVP
jgi:ceramide glucosyltransferase